MLLLTSVPTAPVARRPSALTSGLIATMVFLPAIVPPATDMYVPAQLIGEPVSGQRGRRRSLLAAVADDGRLDRVCAHPVDPGDDVARMVQRFTGGWAMMIGRRSSWTWPTATASYGC